MSTEQNKFQSLGPTLGQMYPEMFTATRPPEVFTLAEVERLLSQTSKETPQTYARTDK
jgi:hypothetical protein